MNFKLAYMRVRSSRIIYVNFQALGPMLLVAIKQ